MEFFVKFLALFVKDYSGEELNNSDRNKFSEKVPSFSYLLRKTLSYNQQCLKKYVVWIKCIHYITMRIVLNPLLINNFQKNVICQVSKSYFKAFT